MIATAIEIHPLALRVPGMTEQEFEALREDIAANGLMRPITLFDGKVLDGRHRLRACEESDVEPVFEEYEGDSPATFVLSLNAKRRNLSTGQLAMLATDFLPDLEAEASARKARGLDVRRGEDGRVVHLSSADHEWPNGGRSAERAAEVVGVSPRAVTRAKQVASADEELAKRVRAGEVTLNAAVDQVVEREQREPTKDGTRKHTAQALVQNLVDKWQYIPAVLGEIDTPSAITTPNAPLAEWDKKLTEAIQALNRLRGDIRKEMSK